MAIYVTGDTHGADKFGFHSVDGFVNRLNMESFPEQKFMTKEDYVIICGDFGGVWNYAGETPKEKHDLDWLDSRNFTTLFVPGNHENYDRLTGLEDKDVINAWMYAGMSDNDKKKILNGYPQKAWNGGMVREIRPSVLMLERGYVFNIDGCKCFAFGGARSHDISGGILKAEDFESKKLANKEAERWNLEGKTFRVNHVSWWEQEMPEQMEMERGWAMLEDEKYKVDFNGLGRRLMELSLEWLKNDKPVITLDKSKEPDFAGILKHFGFVLQEENCGLYNPGKVELIYNGKS